MEDAGTVKFDSDADTEIQLMTFAKARGGEVG